MIPAICFFLTTGIWIYTIYISNILYEKFISTYPDIAKKEIPFAFDKRIGHYKKAYFFIAPSKAYYFDSNPFLFQLRRKFIICISLSLFIPPCIIMIICTLVYLGKI
jgi:hypothetical protein